MKGKRTKHEESFAWPDVDNGPFIFTYRPVKHGKRKTGGYQVTCYPGLHAHRTAGSQCRKCLSLRDDYDDEDIIRSLKLWCLVCEDVDGRAEHKKTNPLDLLFEMPADLDLDAEANQLIDRLAQAQARCSSSSTS